MHLKKLETKYIKFFLNLDKVSQVQMAKRTFQVSLQARRRGTIPSPNHQVQIFGKNIFLKIGNKNKLIIKIKSTLNPLLVVGIKSRI